MRSLIRLCLIVSCIILLWTLAPGPWALSYADTLRLKNGKEMKGIVVEDYVNRLVVSTPDGEKTVMKDDIGELVYDSEEENLIGLAERARARREYGKAYEYYDKALKINPRSKVAKDGQVYCQGYLARKQEVEKEDDVNRRAEFERFGTVGGSSLPADESVDALEAKLDSSLGLTIKLVDGIPAVAAVQPRSLAYKAGVRSGDGLVAVWSRLTGYMSQQEVLALLLDKQSLEMKVTIERTVSVSLNSRRGPLTSLHDLIGMSVMMDLDGIAVTRVNDGGNAAIAGLKDGDIIVAINGERTRYMSLKKAIGLIKNAQGEVKITFRRDVIIWRARHNGGTGTSEV